MSRVKLHDGWNEFGNGYSVYVEDGMVRRATKPDCNGSEIPASVYYPAKGGYDNACPCTVSYYEKHQDKLTIQ